MDTDEHGCLAQIPQILTKFEPGTRLRAITKLAKKNYCFGTGNFCCMALWICDQDAQLIPFVPTATPVA